MLVNSYWVITAKSCFSFDGQPVVGGPLAQPVTITCGRPAEPTPHVDFRQPTASSAEPFGVRPLDTALSRSL
ncbi:hypothetical protein [Micromonospora sp. NPDC049274]|uniref:hypothetical protein n=1 Tax=Micromonospora sp. NPDC049274 TaxID=3154829 RepID=UPI00344A6A70